MHNVSEASLLKGWFFEALSPRQITSRVVFCIVILSLVIVGAISVRNAIKWSERPFPGFLINQRLELGGIGQYHWTGTRAGLRGGDRILEANGKVISSDKDMEDVVNKTSVGDSIKYRIDRAGQLIEVTVPTMRFTVTDLLMTFGVEFFIGVFYLVMGVIVFILKPDVKISWIFLIGCCLESVLYLTAFDVESTHVFIRAYLIEYGLLPAFVVHFSLLFPEKWTLVKKHSYVEAMPYIASAILIIPLELFYPRPPFKPVFRIILLYVILSAIVFILSALRAYVKKSSILARQRAKVVLFGAVLAFPFPAVALLAIPMGASFGGARIITNIAVMPVMIFPVSIAYAIAKHNLFDVDVYIKRAVGYGFMTALVGLTYFSLQIIMTELFRPVIGDYSEKVYPVLFALSVVFLFNPVNRRVQKIIDKLFFRKEFDYKETIIRVSDALTSVLDLNEVVRKIIGTVRNELFIDKAGVLLLEPQKKECENFFIGDETDSRSSGKDECIKYDDPFIDLLSKNKQLITIYDINEDPHYRQVRKTCSERFNRMGVSMVLPLVYQGSVKGALALGYKKSGHFYTREDIDLLNTLANHGAVAIENAKLVDQIKKEEIVRTNLSRYLSPGIVDHIIKKDVEVNLGGNRKTVTVMFLDIVGFTSLSERLQPEEVVAILNEYFKEMSEGIFRWEGTLDKFIGDEIMAFWGAPIEQPNHAELAVRCALDISKRLDDLQKKWRGEGTPVIDCGIGINTGEVLVGNIGVEGKKMDYTIIGDAVNLASRVEKLTRHYKSRIIVTEHTMEHIREAVDSNKMSNVNITDIAEVKVKGKEKGVRIYKLEPQMLII
jgi:class 3 adenylate cyclase